MSYLMHGFTDELCKLAEHKKKKTWRESKEKAVGHYTDLGGAGVGLLAHLLTELSLEKPGPGETLQELTARASQMAKDMKLPSEVVLKRGEPAYAGKVLRMPEEKLVGPALHLTPRQRDAIIAHELGHFAGAIKDPPLLRKIVNISNRLGHHPGMRLGGAALVGATSGLTPTPTYLPAAAMTAVLGPQLFEEAKASSYAIKEMVRRAGLLRGLGKSLPLLPAFGTYAIPLAVPWAVTKARKMYRDASGATEEDRVKATADDVYQYMPF